MLVSAYDPAAPCPLLGEVTAAQVGEAVLRGGLPLPPKRRHRVPAPGRPRRHCFSATPTATSPTTRRPKSSPATYSRSSEQVAETLGKVIGVAIAGLNAAIRCAVRRRRRPARNRGRTNPPHVPARRYRTCAHEAARKHPPVYGSLIEACANAVYRRRLDFFSIRAVLSRRGCGGLSDELMVPATWQSSRPSPRPSAAAGKDTRTPLDVAGGRERCRNLWQADRGNRRSTRERGGGMSDTDTRDAEPPHSTTARGAAEPADAHARLKHPDIQPRVVQGKRRARLKQIAAALGTDPRYSRYAGTPTAPKLWGPGDEA